MCDFFSYNLLVLVANVLPLVLVLCTVFTQVNSVEGYAQGSYDVSVT